MMSHSIQWWDSQGSFSFSLKRMNILHRSKRCCWIEIDTKGNSQWTSMQWDGWNQFRSFRSRRGIAHADMCVCGTASSLNESFDHRLSLFFSALDLQRVKEHRCSSQNEDTTNDGQSPSITDSILFRWSDEYSIECNALLIRRHQWD